MQAEYRDIRMLNNSTGVGEAWVGGEWKGGQLGEGKEREGRGRRKRKTHARSRDCRRGMCECRVPNLLVSFSLISVSSFIVCSRCVSTVYFFYFDKRFLYMMWVYLCENRCMCATMCDTLEPARDGSEETCDVTMKRDVKER